MRAHLLRNACAVRNVGDMETTGRHSRYCENLPSAVANMTDRGLDAHADVAALDAEIDGVGECVGACTCN